VCSCGLQVRAERRSLGEYRAVVETANDNLPRFIQYKDSVMKS
jgi:hypothetical protein